MSEMASTLMPAWGGGDDFGDGAHSDCIGAYGLEESGVGTRLVRGSHHVGIASGLERILQTQLLRCPVQRQSELEIRTHSTAAGTWVQTPDSLRSAGSSSDPNTPPPPPWPRPHGCSQTPATTDGPPPCFPRIPGWTCMERARPTRATQPIQTAQIRYHSQNAHQHRSHSRSDDPGANLPDDAPLGRGELGGNSGPDRLDRLLELPRQCVHVDAAHCLYDLCGLYGGVRGGRTDKSASRPFCATFALSRWRRTHQRVGVKKCPTNNTHTACLLLLSPCRHWGRK
ncbi:hypothetical protein L1887_60839 [Cichorium endivia]|nr:hypothetical protein L1887_60839 [Cichorium endivia]